jgi:DinB superfamily
MSGVTFVKMQLKSSHGLLESTIGEITAEQLHWQPQGKAMAIVAHYGHVVYIEDMVINSLIRRGTPLVLSSYEGKTGLSELPPAPGTGGAFFPAYDEWANRVEMDLTIFREYAKAVFANTDEFVGTLTDETLFEEVETPLGKSTPARWLSVLIIHSATHCGEISCLKGLQDLKGYPM